MPLRIAERWFEIRRVDDGITLLWEPHVDPLLRCNIWHVRGRDRDLMVDTGLGIVSLTDATRHLIDKPVAAVATHAHADHRGGFHEFAERIAHPAEAGDLMRQSRFASLRATDFDPEMRQRMADAGYPLPDELLSALPHEDYDTAHFRQHLAPATRLVDEGDVVDLGDRTFEVLHLPGHSPGSIGLWEAATGTLFSGDAIYDGPLLDELDGSSIPAYIATMERLRALPVTVVHGGHDPSFGRDRLIELADGYLRRRRG
jgi:glyoxylase-like metal-dependent hydrolase (beta-lactamase superfamily II)